ncbi:MAG: HAMP domain-containing histidine kinase [Phycisphaerae bacterium]|nr:HAMP domain-containing histidine kinase [Phycisphaerae bacterium]
MGRRGRFKLSLANKCRMLFGLAVLLIIAAALFVPGYRMESLVHEMNIRTIRQMALAVHAHCDLPGGDWEVKQAELEKWWPLYAEAHQFPPEPVPKLVKLNPLGKEVPEDISTFLKRSIDAMRERNDYNEAHDWGKEPDGTAIYRFALAVRRKNDHKLAGVITAWYRPARTTEELLWNRGALIAAGALAGLLALLVFYLITQKLILSPVRELRRLSEQVAAGDLTVRSRTATGDEYEDLSRAFNDMLAHLQAAQDELRDANRALDIKLDHLAQANVALFEANQLKSEFLANVSHELRTPMSSIIGFAELLKEAHHDGQPRLARYADNILISGRMLLEIINDLLDLAKIEAGKLELRLGRVDVGVVCRDLVELTRSLAAKEGLSLELEVADDLPTLQTDAGKMKQVLYNLLSNAIKFTPEGGRVILGARREGEDHVQLAIVDNGPGIPREYLDKIFEKFRQIDQSKTREHSGTGLGLAISKELVTMLGGSISVSSEVGVGSTFTVLLPIRPPQSAEEADRARRSVAISNE